MQTSGMSESDRIKTIERCLDDAARQVEGYNGFATSADQRAMALASVFIGAASAVTAGIIGWMAAGQPPQAIMISGGLAAAMFYAGALTCLWTAFPQITFVGGNPPEFWLHHLEHKSAYEEALESQIGEYERKIASNLRDRAACALRFRWGAVIGASAPVAGALTYLALTTMPLPG